MICYEVILKYFLSVLNENLPLYPYIYFTKKLATAPDTPLPATRYLIIECKAGDYSK
jgi:hypothetical protein